MSQIRLETNDDTCARVARDGIAEHADVDMHLRQCVGGRKRWTKKFEREDVTLVTDLSVINGIVDLCVAHSSSAIDGAIGGGGHR